MKCTTENKRTHFLGTELKPNIWYSLKALDKWLVKDVEIKENSLWGYYWNYNIKNYINSTIKDAINLNEINEFNIATEEDLKLYLPQNHPDYPKDKKEEWVKCNTQEEWDFVVKKLGRKSRVGYLSFGNCINLNQPELSNFMINDLTNIVYSFLNWCKLNSYSSEYLDNNKIPDIIIEDGKWYKLETGEIIKASYADSNLIFFYCGFNKEKRYSWDFKNIPDYWTLNFNIKRIKEFTDIDSITEYLEEDHPDKIKKVDYTYTCNPFPKDCDFFILRVVKDIVKSEIYVKGFLPFIIPKDSTTWIRSNKYDHDYNDIHIEDNIFAANIPKKYFEIISEQKITNPADNPPKILCDLDTSGKYPTLNDLRDTCVLSPILNYIEKNSEKPNSEKLEISLKKKKEKKEIILKKETVDRLSY